MNNRKPPRNDTSAKTKAAESNNNFNSIATAVVIGVVLIHAVLGGKGNGAIIALADAALATLILVAIIRAIRSKQSPEPTAESTSTNEKQKKKKKRVTRESP